MNAGRDLTGWTPTPAHTSDADGQAGTAARATGPDQDARALEPGVRHRMEARFGEDFSGVRVHAGERGAASAREIGARAYAVGDDVAFAPGRFAPGTPEGEQLLEHELGHVVEARHGAAPGAYRAPEGEQEGAPAAERPVAPPSLHLDPDVGSLSLGLSTLDGFTFNSAALEPGHQTDVADVAGKITMLLEKMPGGSVTVTGHTDLVGGEEANVDLGRRRAEAVRDALVKAGVPAAALRVASEGKHAPVVKTQKADPRNRRVEVRFQGKLIVPDGSGGGPLGRGDLRTDRPAKVDLTPSPGLLPPSGVPPFTPGPRLVAPASRSEPKGYAGPAKAASAGDLVKAITQIPQVKAWIDRKKDEELGRLGRAPTGEKVLLGTALVTMGTLAGAGIASDPAATKTVLGLVDGAEVEVPGLPWLKVKAITKGGGVGGGVTIELSKIVPGLK